MKIAAVQMVSTTRVETNLASARALIAHAARDGAELVVLPEYFCVMGRNDRDKLAIAEAPGDGPIQAMLAQAAREHRVWLIGGTVPLRSPDPEHVWNSNGVYAPDGTRAARYDKIHLFRYDNGRERYDEGSTIGAGDTPTAFQADTVRVGLSVCYDLRFPELYRALMAPPCDLISVPAAFTYPTGLAHWELLLRARGREPVLRDRRGPRRRARERAPHLRPQHDRRPVGRGARRVARRRGRRDRRARCRAHRVGAVAAAGVDAPPAVNRRVPDPGVVRSAPC